MCRDQIINRNNNLIYNDHMVLKLKLTTVLAGSIYIEGPFGLKKHLWGIESEFQLWEPGEISTMLPALIRWKLNSLFIAITTVQDLQPHLSTRWTGQTRLTNSQGAIHESWMARCSPRAPGFSREQYAIYIRKVIKKSSL